MLCPYAENCSFILIQVLFLGERAARTLYTAVILILTEDRVLYVQSLKQ